MPFLKSITSAAVLMVLTTACKSGPDPERVVDTVLSTPPFNGALAVIIPGTLPGSCDALPEGQESQAWTILVNSGFMRTSPAKAADGSPTCSLQLTDRGANRKSFGRIVSREGGYEVPVGGIGTDLPAYETTGTSDSVNVSFTWKFYRFRGVDGLIALDKLPQRKTPVRVADVPPAGRATAMYRLHDGRWDLEAVRLAQQ